MTADIVRRRNWRTTTAVGYIYGSVLLLLLQATSLPSAIAFSTSQSPRPGTRWTPSSTPELLTYHPYRNIVASKKHQSNRLPAFTLKGASASSDDKEQPPSENGGGGDLFPLNFDPFYGGLWAAFLTYGVALSPGQVGDPTDLQMIMSYIDNPSSPTGINPIFLVIFNGLGILPLILAQLSCPQGSSNKGVPALPFLLASMGMGFGAAGAYLTFRGPPVERKTQQEMSWFTRTILENKLVSVGTIVLFVSSVVSTIMMGSDGSSIWMSTEWAQTAVSEFGSLLQTSKLVSVSSLDFTIITIAAATLIPRDYQLRRLNDDDEGESAAALGRQIAVGTLFFPILGAALYCLWRPSLPDK